MQISGEYIKSMILGASKFCSMIFSSPLPIETTKNNGGVNPINVAQKKLLTLTKTSKVQFLGKVQFKCDFQNKKWGLGMPFKLF